MTDKLILFRKDRYNWEDPWGRTHSEPVLRVRAIIRPETNPSVQRFEFVIDPGYGPDSRVPSYGYVIPNLGECRRMIDVVSGMGSWWVLPKGVDMVLHDQHTLKVRHRVVDMFGNPTTNPFGVEKKIQETS